MAYETGTDRQGFDEEVDWFLHNPMPPGADEDVRDLGVIGFANTLPDATPARLAELIAVARRNGRSWDQIGEVLDQTADEAEETYNELVIEGLSNAQSHPSAAAQDRQARRNSHRTTTDMPLANRPVYLIVHKLGESIRAVGEAIMRVAEHAGQR